jgi:hypothetical protein
MLVYDWDWFRKNKLKLPEIIFAKDQRLFALNQFCVLEGFA